MEIGKKLMNEKLAHLGRTSRPFRRESIGRGLRSEKMSALPRGGVNGSASRAGDYSPN
jgi:hypothetical protein